MSNLKVSASPSDRSKTIIENQLDEIDHLIARAQSVNSRLFSLNETIDGPEDSDIKGYEEYPAPLGLSGVLSDKIRTLHALMGQIENKLGRVENFV